MENSPFFKAALAGNFLESATKCVHLPDDDNDAFALLVHWLYYTLTTGTSCFALSTNQYSMLVLVKAYYPADKFMISDLKDLLYGRICSQLTTSRDLTPECLVYASARGEGIQECLLQGLLYDETARGILRSTIRLVGEASSADEADVLVQWQDFFCGGGEAVAKIVSRISFLMKPQLRRS